MTLAIGANNVEGAPGQRIAGCSPDDDLSDFAHGVAAGSDPDAGDDDARIAGAAAAEVGGVGRRDGACSSLLRRSQGGSEAKARTVDGADHALHGIRVGGALADSYGCGIGCRSAVSTLRQIVDLNRSAGAGCSEAIPEPRFHPSLERSMNTLLSVAPLL